MLSDFEHKIASYERDQVLIPQDASLATTRRGGSEFPILLLLGAFLGFK